MPSLLSFHHALTHIRTMKNRPGDDPDVEALSVVDVGLLRSQPYEPFTLKESMSEPACTRDHQNHCASLGGCYYGVGSLGFGS